MRPPWLALVQAAMAPWSGQGVVVAVSGGGDSVALLRVLSYLRDEEDCRLSVATLDHATRAGASTADAAFVADLAARLNLPCDVGHWRADRPGHFEADARRARYAWLLEVAQRRQARAVAVGHTSDDQAETILHRIVRGTGLTGLAGMAPRRPLGPGVTLIRPILGVSGGEVRAYLTSIGQDWREDASNLDPARTRARIRHDLLPALARDFNPNVAAALVRLGQTAAEADRQARRHARRWLDRLTVTRDDTAITLDRVGLSRLDPAARVDLIRLAWDRQGWPAGRMSHARWTRLANLAASGKLERMTVTRGIEALGTVDQWTLRHRLDREVEPKPIPQPLAVPGSVAWGNHQITTSLDASSPMDEWVDRDMISGPLVVRALRPGDRFGPLGLNGHTQPLADFLRSRRVPRPERGQIPLITDDLGIVWVAGHRIAHRVRRTATTTRTLGLRLE